MHVLVPSETDGHCIIKEIDMYTFKKVDSNNSTESDLSIVACF